MLYLGNLGSFSLGWRVACGIHIVRALCVCVSTPVSKDFDHTKDPFPFKAHHSLMVARLCTAAGGQAGYIVAWSTKLAMYPRIWKWDAISTYLQIFLTSFKGL